MSRIGARAILAVAAAAVLVAGCRPTTIEPGPSASRLDLPSGLVDIGGGRHIEAFCSGQGAPRSPIVVLDAGLGNTADVWTSVVRLVEPFATVCSYNRASQGRSDPRPLPHGAASAVDDLHALLVAAHLPPPYVLVGASFGGLDIQLFARRHPTETAGVVLVDSLAAGWDAQLEALLTPAQVADRRAIPNGEDLSNEDIRASEEAVGTEPAPFPAVPLVVLRHGVAFPGGADWPTAAVEDLWASLQAGLAGLSPRSVSLVAADSGHRIHQEQPDLVAEAIHAIVDPSRWPPAAPPTAVAYGSGAAPAHLTAADGWFIFGAADGLHEAAADGSGSRLVVPSDGDLLSEPSVDAAGRLLAYARQAPPAPGASAPAGPGVESAPQVWLTDLVSGVSRQVLSSGQFPRLSPDGGWLAYVENGHTFVVRTDGSGSRDLGEAGCATWAPDGLSLAMCTPDDAVFVLRLADGHQTTVPTQPSLNDPTAWSPDGSTLAIISYRDTNGEIYLIGVDGTNERRLSTAPGTQAAELWIPMGLVVTSSLPDAPVSDWFLVDPATGVPTAIGWLRGAPEPIAFVAGR